MRNITASVYYIGGNDRRLSLFENVFPIPRGVSYNSYFVDDEKTALLDTVDHAVSDDFFDELAALLDGRTLDYAVVNHMEPDHAGTLAMLIAKYPSVRIVCNQKAAVMMKQYFNFDVDGRTLIVKEGDTLSTGRHTFNFVMAPMVHWPEVMMTYDSADKILFSADAFGTFGTLNGNIFADEVNFMTEWLPDARRYYTNIVGKYGTQVQAVLKKAAKLDIAYLCPLHGPIWRKNLGAFIEKYQRWSTYTPEDDAVLIAYASVYGHTKKAAEIIADKLAILGVRNTAMFDVSVTHPSYILSEAFRCSHIVFASTTYNAGIFCNMETLLLDMKAHNLSNRTVALVENGTWAPTALSLMKDIVSSMKNMTVLDCPVTIKSAAKAEQKAALEKLAAAVYDTMKKPEAVSHDTAVEPNALFKLSYGLFILTARDNGRDNGCVINTVTQVTDSPKRITIAVNKGNLTHDMIAATGIFNVSVLTTDTPFNVIKHFGFSSGRDTDKFSGCTEEKRGANGLLYIPKYTNAFISGKVVETQDCGTHTLFTADVTEAALLSREPSLTYQYYFDNIKPKPQPAEKKKKGFVCKVCGYVYEGDTLPADFICPLCKHGAEAFEPIQ